MKVKIANTNITIIDTDTRNIVKIVINKKRFTKGQSVIYKQGQHPFKKGCIVSIHSEKEYPEKQTKYPLIKNFFPFLVKCNSCKGWGYYFQQLDNNGSSMKRYCEVCRGKRKLKTTIQNVISWWLFNHGMYKACYRFREL